MAVLNDYLAARDRGAYTGEAQPEQQVAVKCLLVQRRKRHVFGDDDVGQLPGCEHAARLPEQAVTYLAVIFQQDLAGLDERDCRVAMVGALVQIHGSRLRYQVR